MGGQRTGTLDCDTVLLGSVGSIVGDLVVCLVTVFKTKIIVLEVHIEVGQDELFSDLLPDDAVWE